MAKKLKILIGLLAFAVFIVGAAIAYSAIGKNVPPSYDMLPAAGDDPEAALKKQKAPDFYMHDKDGNGIQLSGLVANGKPIVLNFWASWCPPCKEEMPEFNKVYLELGGEVQFLMVDMTDGQHETVRTGAGYIRENNFSFPVYFDVRQEGAYAYGIRAIPTTVFIDKDGNVVTMAQGAIDEETLRRGISLILSETK
jgi:thiol-disulfide isomerase/thioredoxin